MGFGETTALVIVVVVTFAVIWLTVVIFAAVHSIVEAIFSTLLEIIIIGAAGLLIWYLHNSVELEVRKVHQANLAAKLHHAASVATWNRLQYCGACDHVFDP